VYARDLELNGTQDTMEVFRCFCGIDLEFPVNQTLVRDLALKTAIEFFQTGQLPRCVHWEMGM
jgi:hypothetical protein